MASVISLTKQQLINAVKAHALEHYEDGGWDVIVECFTDHDILELIGNARSTGGAIKAVEKSAVSFYADRQADARNSAF